jgi:hypothetical protein
VFVMLNLVAAGWITLVVLASKDDPTIGNARLVNGALTSTVIVLVLSLITPATEDGSKTPVTVDSAHVDDGRGRKADA